MCIHLHVNHVYYAVPRPTHTHQAHKLFWNVWFDILYVQVSYRAWGVHTLEKKKKKNLFLLDCQVIWHALETSLEQKLSAGPSRYKEEESCSDIIAVVPRHVRILPLFFGFPQVRFCCYLFSIEWVFLWASLLLASWYSLYCVFCIHNQLLPIRVCLRKDEIYFKNNLLELK